MKVRDVLKGQNRTVRTTSESAILHSVMKSLIDHKISCLPVLRDDRLIGIVSDKDIFRKVYESPENFRQTKVSEVMTSDLIVGIPEDELSYIAGIMTKNRIRHMPIIENDRLIGLISIGDIVKAQMDDIETENRYLRQYVERG